MKRVALVAGGIAFGILLASFSSLSPSAEAKVTDLVSPGDEVVAYIYGGDMKFKVVKLVDDCWVEAKGRGGYTHYNLCTAIAFKVKGKK